MKHSFRNAVAVVAALSCFFTVSARSSQLQLVRTITLPGVNGRIDHMDIDLARQHLFVSALGNDTVEVVDLASGKRIQTLSGFHESQGVGYDKHSDRLVVANGGSGVCNFIDASSFHSLTQKYLGDDADDVRMDHKTGRAVIGFGEGAIAIIDMESLKTVSSWKFRGHPEAFASETKGHHIYVNVPSENKIDVIDTRAGVTSWPLTGARDNFPMALDEADHRLFIGCRSPARLLVYNTTAGTLAASLPIADDTDDVYYNPKTKLIYVSCGAGEVNVIRKLGNDSYKTIESVPTASGARTSLLIPEMKLLCVAAPRRQNHDAEILVFSIQ